MVAQGHHVAAVTRTKDKLDRLKGEGITPVLCDVFDRERLVEAVTAFKPDIVVHQVTDLPDEMEKIREYFAANNRVRSEGTDNLLHASKSANAGLIAQSIAWSGNPVVEAHEKSVLEADGTVLRYGQFYGPGTYFENDIPPAPRIQIDDAAERTMSYLGNPGGVFSIVEDISVGAE